MAQKHFKVSRLVGLFYKTIYSQHSRAFTLIPMANFTTLLWLHHYELYFKWAFQPIFSSLSQDSYAICRRAFPSGKMSLVKSSRSWLFIAGSILCSNIWEYQLITNRLANPWKQRKTSTCVVHGSYLAFKTMSPLLNIRAFHLTLFVLEQHYRNYLT